LTTVAVDLGKAGVPIFNRHGSVKVRSLFDPEHGLEMLGDADDPEASPNA